VFLNDFGFIYQPEDIKHGCDQHRCMFNKVTIVQENRVLEHWLITLIADNPPVVCQGRNITEDSYRGFTTSSCSARSDNIENEVHIRGEDWHLIVHHTIYCPDENLSTPECEAQYSSVFDLVDAFLEEMASQNIIELNN